MRGRTRSNNPQHSVVGWGEPKANPNKPRTMLQRWGYGLHQQPALWAIRYADVRYGILPSQSPLAHPNLR
jgi:hypothetical protein